MEDFLAKAKHKPAAGLLTEWAGTLGLPNGTALDLGCGVGAEAEFLARHGFSVDAVDISDTAIRATLERCAGLPVSATLADFRTFEIAPERYILATAINALPFIPKDDAVALLKRVQTGLAAGGAAILAVYGHGHDWRDRQDMSFWEADEFRALWDGWKLHHFQEHMGMVPLVGGEEIFQHRIQLVAQKMPSLGQH